MAGEKQSPEARSVVGGATPINKVARPTRVKGPTTIPKVPRRETRGPTTIPKVIPKKK